MAVLNECREDVIRIQCTAKAQELVAIQVFTNQVLCLDMGLRHRVHKSKMMFGLAGHFVGLTPFWWGAVNQRLRYCRCAQGNPVHQASVRV